MSRESAPDTGVKVLVVNKKARFEYHILETFEAGIVLTGAEIKSVRKGDISIAEAYVRPDADALYLLGAHIKPYSHSGDLHYDPVRPRKLLLKQSEIDKLRGRVETKGLTIVPLQVHLRRGYAKLDIGLARGKAAPDKRSSIRDREASREMARAVKRG